VSRGRVLDEAAILFPPSDLDAAVARLCWPSPDAPDDWPWLVSWLRSPRARASFVVVADPPDRAALAAAVRAALPPRFAALAAGANVEAIQGEP
jgi:type IV secretory pathway protease TraF